MADIMCVWSNDRPLKKNERARDCIAEWKKNESTFPII